MTVKNIEITNKDDRHISVLLEELVNSIEIFDNRQNIIVDTTLGMAGHAIQIIKKMNKGDIFIGFDADDRNLKLAKINIENSNPKPKIILINSNFINLKEELNKVGIEKITGIYYDLGLSSLHLDEAERGFSFMRDGPLDMRLDNNSGKTAKDIINYYNAGELREIFMKYGESSQSNKVAHKIVDSRKNNKFETTFDLSEVIAGGPKEKSKIFQALRIEVNKELEAMEKSIPDAINLLEKDGNIFVISFHSLEDRITKNIFRRETKDCICTDLICSCHHKKSLKLHSKKPILPSEEEIKYNKRSRSAKARGATKII
ncbi:MAG: 16S rRNA (cytosine(1402)-N(4))-methyltransferase RsmH [Candidatus Gracilibacteria bacterium]|nr:16S rRNA (cytosine(1402)-N(4))-methyltransferase RsmH [Candidatus Gracilibacteria bacterium]MDQ7022813.1 16S rRNA (cytosine(1402)-N(4))-methyltransferase RsmH [Candidatus Gracilibacteria bacterium]